MPSYEYEEKHYAEGYTAVCGTDEAGRGPLCGPVVAAACILPADCVIEELNDSKKLTEKKRNRLFQIVHVYANHRPFFLTQLHHSSFPYLYT